LILGRVRQFEPQRSEGVRMLALFAGLLEFAADEFG
jgi:hypothetical protein